MPAKTLMIQGTASSVGKSIMVAALCRMLKQDGFRVAPFKAQNMALNSFVTREGGEIGRAQAVQAEAAGIEPSIYMNPVLLKTEADAKSQVIVMGKVMSRLDARSYYDYTPLLLQHIEESLKHLRSNYDIVVIEGAGSPAEINFREREIVNMRVAHMADAPVILVGDIDRGGVFASLVGTLELLTDEERSRIKGFIINKFRGDVTLLKPGLDILERRTGRPVLGIIPYFHDISIAQEDSVYLDERPDRQVEGGLDIAVIQLPYLSNYDDFDPFERHGCTVRYVKNAAGLEKPDLIILPGTKNTVADLQYLKRQGLAQAIIDLVSTGTPLIGICGGYQMMGKTIEDPDHVESEEDGIVGLGLLDIRTTFMPDKTTTQVKGKVAASHGLLAGLADIEVVGYEIHMGQTSGPKPKPAFQITETPDGNAAYFDGAVSENGWVFGTYMHGLFDSDKFTGALLHNLRLRSGMALDATAELHKQDDYDKLAHHVRQHLNMECVYKIAGIDHP